MLKHSFNKEITENINYNIYHPSEKIMYKIMYKNNINNEYRINPVKYDDNIEFEELNENHTGIINSLDSPLMDSPWPMYCHDVRHTGRSPYSTVDNSFYNKWWFKSYDYIEGSGVIDKDGVIYFGS